MKATGRSIEGLIRQSGDTVTQMEDGTWEAQVKYLSTWPAAAYYAPRRNSASHPDFPALICKACQINRLKPGRYAEVIATYRGFVAPDDQNQPNPQDPLGNSVEEIITGTSDQPIQTHPGFVTLIGGTKATPLNDAIFDDDGKFQGFPASSLYAGIESYLVPSTIYRQSTPSRNRPSSLGPVGTIAAPPITGPSDTNWLFTSRVWRRDGGIYEVTEEYLLSPPGGWDPTIYGS
ncbi:hypothetical protein BH20VER3_BH20VER3_00990 [soil metagenome]